MTAQRVATCHGTPCPSCGADEWQPCMTRDGHLASRPHLARQKAHGARLLARLDEVLEANGVRLDGEGGR